MICAKYEKYFHDYLDDILSLPKTRDYKAHLERCSYCGGVFRQHVEYRKSLDAIARRANPPKGADLRFKGRLQFIMEGGAAMRQGFVSASGVTHWPRKDVGENPGIAKTVVLMGKVYLLDEYAAELFSAKQGESAFLGE